MRFNFKKSSKETKSISQVQNSNLISTKSINSNRTPINSAKSNAPLAMSSEYGESKEEKKKDQPLIELVKESQYIQQPISFYFNRKASNFSQISAKLSLSSSNYTNEKLKNKAKDLRNDLYLLEKCSRKGFPKTLSERFELNQQQRIKVNI